MSTRVQDVRLLQSVADLLNRQTSSHGSPNVWFTVGTAGITFHLTRGMRTVTIDAVVTEEGDEVCIALPRGRVAAFKKAAVLDRAHPTWNN